MSIHAVAFAVLAAIHPPPATTERTDAFIDSVAPPGAGHWLPTDPAQRAAVRKSRPPPAIALPAQERAQDAPRRYVGR